MNFTNLKNFTNSKGFTLIEIMLTMALLGVVALVASPFSGRFVFSQEVPVARDELQGSVSKARLYSMLGKNDSSWGVTVSDQKLYLFQGDSFASRNQDFDETFALHPEISVSGLDEVTFARMTGRPDAQPTVVVSGNGAAETLIMNMEGVLESQ